LDRWRDKKKEKVSVGKVMIESWIEGKVIRKQLSILITFSNIRFLREESWLE